MSRDPRRRDVLAGLGAGVATIVGAGILPAGCRSSGTREVDFSDANRTFRPDDYDRVRNDWTRHDKLVRDIGTVIEIWATYKSAEFRQAYVEQYASVYNLSADERRELRTAQLEAARLNYEFHVVAQSTEWKWNDLEHRDSVWKTTLGDRGKHEIAPSQITFQKLPELYVMRFFPIRTDFSRTYTIKFPRDGAGAKFDGVETGLLALKVTGPLGAATVSWESRRE